MLNIKKAAMTAITLVTVLLSVGAVYAESFIVQPTGEMTVADGSYTITWQTDFEPFVVAVYKVGEDEPVLHDITGAATSCEVPSASAEYFVKAWYNDGNSYIDSNTASFTQLAFIGTYKGLSSPGGEILNLKYDINFTAKEVRLWKDNTYQSIGEDVSSGTFYVKADDDTPYHLTATYISDKGSFTIESEPFYVKQSAAFSVQPKDITVYGVSKGKVSFDTNFTPKSLFLIHGDTTTAIQDGSEHIIDASDTPYKIRASYENGFYSFAPVTGYIDSDEFYVKQGSAFIAQPKGGATETGSKFTVPFKLNFTPTYIIVNRGNIYAYATLEPGAEYYEADISEEPYYIIASYDGGSVTSEPFYISVRQKGDVNADGKQDEEDAAVLMKHLTDIIKLDNRSLEYAKTDGSEQSVNMLDVIAMLKLADELRE